MGKQKIADSETGDRSAELPGNLFFGSLNQKSERSRCDSRVISGGRKEILGIPGGQWTSMPGTVRRKCVIGIPARPFACVRRKKEVLVIRTRRQGLGRSEFPLGAFVWSPGEGEFGRILAAKYVAGLTLISIIEESKI